MVHKRIGAGRILRWFIPLAFLLVFYFFPLGKITAVSMSTWKHDGLSSWPGSIIANAIGFTLFEATVATLLTILIGLPAAYLFSHFRFKGRAFMRVAATLPFILPTVVVAAAFNALIGPRGWLNLMLIRIFNLSQPPITIQNSLAAILLALVFYNVSVVIRVVSTAWEGLDIRLENAARTLGASPIKVLKEITLPLLRPSILSAFLLVFLFDFTSFGVILMMGGPQFTTLEVEIYIQTMQFLNLPLAGVLSLIQLIFSMLITAAIVQSGRAFSVPVMPRVKSENLRHAKKPREKVFQGFILTILLVLLVLPLVALTVQAFVGIGENGNRQITFDHFRELSLNTRQSYFYVPPIVALRNSLLYALAASGLALLLGFLLASVTSRSRFIGRLVNWLVLLPLGTSAVTFGLGLLLAFGLGATSSRWYPLLIPIAHALIALPFVLRLLEPALHSIPANLRWAARTLGASPRDVWRFVELPIVWRMVITAFVYAFAISLGEFGATTFLTRPDIPTLPIAIYRYLNLPGSSNFGQAMAMAVILLAVCALSMLIVDRLQINMNNPINNERVEDKEIA